ncbi:MAG: ROK family protein [Erysipelotrichaceae bacterium]|nr:ROK family protein [Erysipelotrichaceae bacterium]
MLYGGIELGGTKMVAGIADDDNNIVEQISIATKEPEKTLNKLYEYFLGKNIASLGIASFGPVDLNKSSSTYGYITTTPKPGWGNVDVLGHFKALNIPLGFDTDVNGACLGEVIHGAGRGLNNVIYGTIGTGIGFGVYLEGKLLHGLMHPETGHMILKRHPDDEDFEGPCPYHSDCLETLASGPSIESRWHKKARGLTDDDKVWRLEAYYLGQALTNCVMCYSPERIILGGGIMHVEKLLPLIREETLKDLNGYIKKDEILNDIDSYIVLPELGDNAGLIGAIELGKKEI